MKTVLCWMLLSVLAVGPALGATLKVSASQALRIALIDTERGDREAGERFETAFAPVFERSVQWLYGRETAVEFIHVSLDEAAQGLRDGRFDAGILLQAKVPSAIKRTGCHAVRVLPFADRADKAIYLVLRREEPQLDALLANAFSAASNHELVRQALLNAPLLARR